MAKRGLELVAVPAAGCGFGTVFPRRLVPLFPYSYRKAHSPHSVLLLLGLWVGWNQSSLLAKASTRCSSVTHFSKRPLTLAFTLLHTSRNQVILYLFLRYDCMFFAHQMAKHDFAFIIHSPNWDYVKHIEQHECIIECAVLSHTSPQKKRKKKVLSYPGSS